MILFWQVFNFFVLAARQENKEVKKKPEAVESVDNLINKKDSERQADGMAQVLSAAEGVVGEVSEVMGGMEKPSEKISERKGDSGEKGDIKAGGQSSDDKQAASQIRTSLNRRALPSEEIMIKKIRSAINSQIATEMKKASKLEKNLASGSAQEYNQSIAKVRALKEILKSLFTSTLEAVKGTYFKYFGTDGKRKLRD